MCIYYSNTVVCINIKPLIYIPRYRTRKNLHKAVVSSYKNSCKSERSVLNATNIIQRIYPVRSVSKVAVHFRRVLPDHFPALAVFISLYQFRICYITKRLPFFPFQISCWRMDTGTSWCRISIAFCDEGWVIWKATYIILSHPEEIDTGFF